ncbi:MAG: sugar phosphate nucleotidyltransferase [Dehalococcoidia bacterium]|nr:sugar phosphate nucleotidyltransferase [Dehalococcoidia bacterium]
MEQAIILAAGEGQRLRPLTRFKPKVMLSIGNKPILQHILEAVAANGIRRIVLIVGYRKEQVQDYFGSGESLGIEITYVEQKQQLGTAHALKQAQTVADDSFLVISGDNIVRPNTIARMMNAEPPCVLVKPRDDVSKYGVVVTHRNLVTSIVEKPQGEGSNLVNTGIYSFSREIFSFIEGEVDLPPVINRMADDGVPVRVCETNDVWLDVVYPWDMLKLNALVLEQNQSRSGGQIEHGTVIKGPVDIGEGTIVRSGSYLVGPLSIGKDCEIGPHACIFPSTSIGDNVTVSSFCSVRNCIVGNNIQLGPSSHIEDSIIGRGSQLGGHFMAHGGQAIAYIDEEPHHVNFGTVVGEHSIIGANVVVKPGTFLGNRCRIQSLKLLQENIPDDCLVA